MKHPIRLGPLCKWHLSGRWGVERGFHWLERSTVKKFPDTPERRAWLFTTQSLNYLGFPFQTATHPPGGILIFKDAFACKTAHFFP